MTITKSGIPAGYGGFTIASVKDENIIEDIVADIKENSTDNQFPVIITSMSIKVKGSDAKVSINDRPDILIEDGSTLSFDSRCINSVKFKADGINYNIIYTY